MRQSTGERVICTRIRGHKLMLSAAFFAILVLLVCPASGFAQSPPVASQPYEDVFYPSGSLRIQVHIFKPAGEGPFPAVVYNHGSRAGRERIPVPFTYIAARLAADGYVVLVPERRGYGLSEGTAFSEAVGRDRGQRFVSRMREETDDVLAAAEFLKTLPYVDTKRVGIMGWSLGGIVSVFAAGRSQFFSAVIDQAGAALTWDFSPEMRRAMKESAARIRVPLLAMDAENDRTLDAVKSVVSEVEKSKGTAKLIVYPKFTPSEPTGGVAPGHLIFGREGAEIWTRDVQQFLAEHLSGNKEHAAP